MGTANFDFSGEVAIISGASRGIGRQMAVSFAKAGTTVIAVDRDIEALNLTNSATKSLNTDLIIPFQMDIRDSQQVVKLMEFVNKDYGRLDILINNAAVAPKRSLRDYPESLWKKVYDTNCKGTFLMTQAAAENMIHHSTAGRIVNLSSGAALKGGCGSAAYASSRAAVESFSRVAATELAPYGILLNTIRLGLFDTQPKPLPPHMKAQLETHIPTIPLQRPGTAQEAVNVAMFLASNLSSYMTGSIVTVDGGSSVGTFSNRPIVDDDSRYAWLAEEP